MLDYRDDSLYSRDSTVDTTTRNLYILKHTSEMQPPPLTGHHGSAPFDIPPIDMCTFEFSKIRAHSYSE